MNFSNFYKWDRDIEGAGCYPDCYDFHALTLDMSAGYRWTAELKERKFPYVCIGMNARSTE